MCSYLEGELLVDAEYIDKLNLTVRYLESKIDSLPKTAIILGTGQSMFVEILEDIKEIPYEETPFFLRATAPGHIGSFVSGKISGIPVLCMVGRFHYYEGYSFEELSIPIHILKILGIENLILTNAAGAVNRAYTTGSIVLISDHINLVGASPTRGQVYKYFGNRFFDISNVYDAEMRKLALNAAANLSLDLRSGVYMYFTGPHFETAAEIRAAKALGADLVGMSTVPEAITAAQCGIRTLGLSVVTNMATGISSTKESLSQIESVAQKATSNLEQLVMRVLPQFDFL